MNKKFRQKKAEGSALLLTILILSGILSISIASGYLVWSNTKMLGVQSNSIKAYYTAETGAEEILWETRKNSMSLSDPGGSEPIIQGQIYDDRTYEVYYRQVNPIKFDCIGDYENTKRSVQLTY